MKKLYLSGPMTGIPEFNFPAFFEAEAALADRYQVVSPARMTIALWLDLRFINSPADWRNMLNNPVERSIPVTDYLRNDFKAIADCQAMALLPGWRNSDGAAKELKIAQMLNLELYEIDGTYNLIPLNLNGWKFSGNKRQWDLFYRPFLRGVCDILTGGAMKYAPAPPDNWKHVPDAQRQYKNAMARHVDAILNGESIDPETGRPHTYHVGCNAMFLSWFEDNDRIDGDKADEIEETIKI